MHNLEFDIIKFQQDLPIDFSWEVCHTLYLTIHIPQP